MTMVVTGHSNLGIPTTVCHVICYTITVLIVLNGSAKHYKKQDVYLQAFLKQLVILFDSIIF
jgi:hypothetical protein